MGIHRLPEVRNPAWRLHRHPARGLGATGAGAGRSAEGGPPLTAAPLVLVVEDTAANLALVRALLRRGGYRLSAAGSLAEARRRLAGEPPALILLDLGLPDGDGLELLEALRGHPWLERVPVVALTAYATPADRERALRAGCIAFLSKPLDTRTFLRDIAAVCPQRGEHDGASAGGGR